MHRVRGIRWAGGPAAHSSRCAPDRRRHISEGAEITPEELEQTERAMHALEDHDLQRLVALEKPAA